MQQFASSFQIDVTPAPYSVVVVAAVMAGITDVLWFKVYNLVTFPLAISGVICHSFFPAGQGVAFTLAGALFGLAVLIPFYILGGVGAGDVKLLAGIGAWIGWHDVWAVFLAAALLTGIYSALLITVTTRWRSVGTAYMMFVRQPRSALRMLGDRQQLEEVKQNPHTRRGRFVPMGTAIALALLILIYLQSYLPA